MADDLNLWIEVTGGQKKGRTIGAGNVGDPRYVLTGESSSSRPHIAGPSTLEVDTLRSQLEDYQSRLTEEQAMRMALEQSVVEMRQRCDEERMARERFEEAAREREVKAEEERLEIRRMMETMMQSRRDPPPPSE